MSTTFLPLVNPVCNARLSLAHVPYGLLAITSTAPYAALPLLLLAGVC